MAIVNIPERRLRIDDVEEISAFLSKIDIDYKRWKVPNDFLGSATESEILEAYSKEIEWLKESGGYVTADVIDVTPETSGLDAMLDKFNKEHWHRDDEVRFVVKGHGIFHIAGPAGEVVSIELEAGDLIRIPGGTRHWFDLCIDRTIRAIRLFQDPFGWTPYFTGSGVDAGYQPLCLGVSYIPTKK